MRMPWLLIPLLTLAACYSPEQYEGASASNGNSTASSDFGTVYEVNGSKQICNPSVSMDTVNYPGAMLWLNFSGSLNVEGDDGYKTSGAAEHDRLTVSDTAGKVLWYVMKDSVPGAECAFQDPEWSTDADFVVALASFKTANAKSCSDDYSFGIVAIRVSDKRSMFLVDSAMEEFANPHLWVGEPLAEIDSADSIQVFFGTDQVKLVYVSASGNLVYVDYLKSAKANKLSLPDSSAGMLLDSPLISPDGNFVAFDVLEDSYTWKSYIQELSTTSDPVRIEKTDAMISDPVFPHWWRLGSRLFVVWTEFSSGNSYLNKSDLTNESTWDGSLGRTAMREVVLSAGAPRDVAVEWTGDVREIAPIPLIGGRSPDGHFVATGTNNGYLLYIP